MWQSVLGQLCACLELGSSDTSPEQLNLLHQGGKFVRSLYLGFSSQELLMELSLDNAIVKWKTVDATEFGEIDFSGNIKTVKSTGQQVCRSSSLRPPTRILLINRGSNSSISLVKTYLRFKLKIPQRGTNGLSLSMNFWRCGKSSRTRDPPPISPRQTTQTKLTTSRREKRKSFARKLSQLRERKNTARVG
jgi:hypothetical protein